MKHGLPSSSLCPPPSASAEPETQRPRLVVVHGTNVAWMCRSLLCRAGPASQGRSEDRVQLEEVLAGRTASRRAGPSDRTPSARTECPARPWYRPAPARRSVPTVWRTDKPASIHGHSRAATSHPSWQHNAIPVCEHVHGLRRRLHILYQAGTRPEAQQRHGLNKTIAGVRQKKVQLVRSYSHAGGAPHCAGERTPTVPGAST